MCQFLKFFNKLIRENIQDNSERVEEIERVEFKEQSYQILKHTK